MSKVIKFEFNDKAYTLEFTRKSIEQMERSGFVANDIVVKPMTTLPALFAGAFLAHHRFTQRSEIDEIFGSVSNKTDLIGKLAEMYNEPIVALMDDSNEGNVKWEASW